MGGGWEEPAQAARSQGEHAACAGKKQQGSAPHPAGAHLFLFFTWSQWARRFGWRLPDPLLLAPDPSSWLTAHQTRPGQLLLFFTWSQWARRFGWRLPDPLLLASDPFSWHIAHQTRHKLGSYKYTRNAAIPYASGPPSCPTGPKPKPHPRPAR